MPIHVDLGHGIIPQTPPPEHVGHLVEVVRAFRAGGPTLMLWLKALHIMAVIAWMAGLFYLPRLYVYHARSVAGSELAATFKVMEERLLRVIMNPAMIVVWITGPLLVWWEGVLLEGWMLAKLTLVAAMTVFHMALARWRREFAADQNTRSENFFRAVNELPTLLMAAIVILVVVKPF